MARRKRQPQSVEASAFGFVFKNIAAIIAIGGLVFGLASTWFGTQGQLTTLVASQQKDNVARQELRQALTTNSEKTAEAIAKLATQSAVQETKLNLIGEQLSHATTQLQGLSLAAGKGK